MGDVLIDQQLGRQDAGERHVVLDPDGPAGAELLDQPGDGRRIE